MKSPYFVRNSIIYHVTRHIQNAGRAASSYWSRTPVTCPTSHQERHERPQEMLTLAKTVSYFAHQSQHTQEHMGVAIGEEAAKAASGGKIPCVTPVAAAVWIVV